MTSINQRISVAAYFCTAAACTAYAAKKISNKDRSENRRERRQKCNHFFEFPLGLTPMLFSPQIKCEIRHPSRFSSNPICTDNVFYFVDSASS